MTSEERDMSKNSKNHRVNVERFAYDVFSYMLPMCGFPETAIPSSNIEENDYKDKDFVQKSGLSVLPLSMYVRDGWKNIFESRHLDTPFNSLEIIRKYLQSTLTKNPDFEGSDEATKIRISLAFFNEIMLFLNCKGLETHMSKLSEFWSHFYSEFTKNQDIEGLFASSFFMFPEATGSPEWVINFVKKYAVPYGSKIRVSRCFSVYSILSEDSRFSPLSKTSKNDATDKSSKTPGASNFTCKKWEPSLVKNFDLQSTLKGCREFSDPSHSSAFIGTDASLNAQKKCKAIN